MAQGRGRVTKHKTHQRQIPDTAVDDARRIAPVLHFESHDDRLGDRSFRI